MKNVILVWKANNFLYNIRKWSAEDLTSVNGWGAKSLQPKIPLLENSSLQIPPQRNPSSKIPPQENTSQQNISRQNTYQQNTSKNKKPTHEL